MKYDYNLELNNILNKIYKEIILKILVKEDNLDIYKESIDKIKDILLNKKVFLGSDMDDFIINSLPEGREGDLFRCSIAKYHKHLHPIFETQSGEPVEDPTYNNFGLLMFRSHMNNLLISDVQGLFNQSGYESFVMNNLSECFSELKSKIVDIKNNVNPIIINFDDKKYLLNVVKNMIDRKELEIEYAYKLVDMDKLRDYMVKMAVTFDYYDEFDKLEEDTRFCLDNFCKYDAFELYDFLVNEEGFELLNEGTLVKN